MAGTMGYQKLTKLTHEIENHLLSLKTVSKSLLQVLFGAADKLQNFYDTISKDKDPEKIEVDSVINALKSPSSTSFTRTTTPSKAVEDEILRVGNKYKVIVKFDTKTKLLGARGFQAYRFIDSVAQILISNPPIDVLEEGKLLGDIEMEIISYESERDITAGLQKVDDVTDVLITNLLESAELQPKISGRGSARSLASIQSVRVNLDRLDQVVDLLGELVITRGRFQSLLPSLNPEILEQFQIFDNTISTIQDTVMSLRMVNLSRIFETFPRAVRDIAHDRGMEIDLLLQGTQFQLDRSVVDQVSEALLHLIRNAAIHGIEDKNTRKKAGKPSTGRIRLAAKRERGEVVIEVEDDGAGLDIERIRAKAIENKLISPDQPLSRAQIASLIFRPGFSTASEVTDIAGRGVGMDIVKARIDEISGSIQIRTKKGEGTRFIIRVPQTLAIVDAIIVDVRNQQFAIPLVNIEKIFSLKDPAIDYHGGVRYLNYEGHNVRIINLTEKLISFGIVKDNKDKKSEPLQSREKVILWEKGGVRLGLLVDNIKEQREIVTKQLDDVTNQIRGFAGATILGYDEVALIIDPDTIAEMN